MVGEKKESVTGRDFFYRKILRQTGEKDEIWEGRKPIKLGVEDFVSFVRETL